MQPLKQGGKGEGGGVKGPGGSNRAKGAKEPWRIRPRNNMRPRCPRQGFFLLRPLARAATPLPLAPTPFPLPPCFIACIRMHPLASACAPLHRLASACISCTCLGVSGGRVVGSVCRVGGVGSGGRVGVSALPLPLPPAPAQRQRKQGIKDLAFFSFTIQFTTKDCKSSDFQ